MVLPGHKHQAMTNMYNDDRGLSRGKWNTLTLNTNKGKLMSLKEERIWAGSEANLQTALDAEVRLDAGLSITLAGADTVTVVWSPL